MLWHSWYAKFWIGVGFGVCWCLIIMSGLVFAQNQASTDSDVETTLKEIGRLEVKASSPRLRAPPVQVQTPTETTHEAAQTTGQGLGIIDSASVDFRKLSLARQKLIVAYENFMQQLPTHEKVPELLYDEGAILFEMKLYPNARIAFERILNQYPKSGKWYVDALANVVESYRRENDYKNLEVWSERLRSDPNAPDSLRNAGENLAAGAIANQANQLASQSAEKGDTAMLVKAAEEYIRTARTYPKAEFAAISLYNAGYTYKKAKVLDKAADVWLDLVQRYPKVSYADTAMWESALAYDEMKDYKRALEVYNQFVENFPKTEFRSDALKNIVFNYTELKDWTNSAQAYERYTTEFPEQAGGDRSYKVGLAWVRANDLEKAGAAFDRFSKENPSSPRVKEVQFELGQAWLKAGNIDKANIAFGRFAKENPSNPLSVKIRYDLGEYYLKKDQKTEAKQQYDDAVELSISMEKKGQDGNVYYRGESYSRLAELAYPDFENIKLKLPQKDIDQQFQRKKDLFKQLAEYYQGVVKSGSIRGAEATYRLSAAYEDLGKTWLVQERPAPQKEVLKRVDEIKTFNASAIGFFNDAIKPLETVNLKHAKDFADVKYDTTWTTTRDSIVAITPVDTTENQWVTKSKEKVVDLSAQIANLLAEPYEYFMDHFFEVPLPPIPAQAKALGAVGATVFQNQVWTQGLEAADAQIVKEVLPAYQRAIDYSKPGPEGYDIHGPAIQRAGDSAIRTAMLTLIKTEGRLPLLFNDYQKSAAKFVSLIDSLVYRPEKIKDTFAFGDILYKVIDDGELPNYQEITMELARQMAPKYENIISIANSMNIKSALVDSLKDRLIRFHYETGSAFQKFYQNTDELTIRYFDRVAQIDSIIAAGGKSANVYQQAQATQVLNDMISDATGGWDTIKLSFQNNAIEIYENGYQYKDIYPISSDWYTKIRTQLTALDPQRYPPPSEEFKLVFGSDTSWRVSAKEVLGWNAAGFSGDTSWEGAQIGQYPISNISLPGLEQSNGIAITRADSSSLIYVRKEFKLFGKPDSCVIVIASTAPFELFVNGFSSGKSETADANIPKAYNITSNLLGGSNNAVGIKVMGVSPDRPSVIFELRGIDRVPLASEKLDAARQYYRK